MLFGRGGLTLQLHIDLQYPTQHIFTTFHSLVTNLGLKSNNQRLIAMGHRRGPPGGAQYKQVQQTTHHFDAASLAISFARRVISFTCIFLLACFNSQSIPLQGH